MRFQKHLAPCLAILAVHSAFAAEPVPAGKQDPLPSFLITPSKAPLADPGTLLPQADPIPRPAAPPSLLPDDIPTNTKKTAPAIPPAAVNPFAAKPAAVLKPQVTAAELDMRVRYRKARNIAETSEQIHSAWEATRYPRNDQQKRQAMKRYYDLLFAKMLSLDRGIATLVEERRKAETAILTQTHIAPTVVSE